MFIQFYFDNEYKTIVEKKILELLDENDVSEKAVVLDTAPDRHKFCVVAIDSVDEGLAVKLIKEFDWPSMGVERPVDTKNNGLVK